MKRWGSICNNSSLLLLPYHTSTLVQHGFSTGVSAPAVSLPSSLLRLQWVAALVSREYPHPYPLSPLPLIVVFPQSFFSLLLPHPSLSIQEFCLFPSVFSEAPPVSLLGSAVLCKGFGTRETLPSSHRGFLCSPPTASHCLSTHNIAFNMRRGQNQNPMAGTQVWESTLWH